MQLELKSNPFQGYTFDQVKYTVVHRKGRRKRGISFVNECFRRR